MITRKLGCVKTSLKRNFLELSFKSHLNQDETVVESVGNTDNSNAMCLCCVYD